MFSRKVRALIFFVQILNTLLVEISSGTFYFFLWIFWEKKTCDKNLWIVIQVFPGSGDFAFSCDTFLLFSRENVPFSGKVRVLLFFLFELHVNILDLSFHFSFSVES